MLRANFVKTMLIMLSVIWPLAACLIGGPASTAIPPVRPANFEVQTATPTTNPRLITPTPNQNQDAAFIPLSDAPTYTPDPNAPPTSLVPTDTPLPAIATPTLTPTVALTPTVIKIKPTEPPDPPLQGGEWDFETDFIPWPNPHGEPCPGARVA
jgi:hypothetical protein